MSIGRRRHDAVAVAQQQRARHLVADVAEPPSEHARQRRHRLARAYESKTKQQQVTKIDSILPSVLAHTAAMSRNDNRRDDDNRRDGRDRDRDRDQDRDRDRRRDRDHDRDDRDRDRDRNRGGSLRAGANERRGFGAPPPARPHGRRSVFDDGDYDGAAIAKEAVPQGATGEDDGKKSTFRYRQGLQFVDQVPDFLKGLIKPKQPMYNPNGDSDDEGAAGNMSSNF